MRFHVTCSTCGDFSEAPTTNATEADLLSQLTHHVLIHEPEEAEFVVVGQAEEGDK